jgi:hypothetical protein
MNTKQILAAALASEPEIGGWTGTANEVRPKQTTATNGTQPPRINDMDEWTTHRHEQIDQLPRPHPDVRVRHATTVAAETGLRIAEIVNHRFGSRPA